MQNTTAAKKSQGAPAPVYVSLRGVQAIAGVSRSHALRHITPHLSRFEFGPRCIRYRADEVCALLASMGGDA